MLESEKKQILKEQLQYLYKLNEINLKNRFAIKNWCIVVWLGIIVVLLKEANLFVKTNATEINPSLPLLVFLPVFLFWFVEAVYGGQTKLYRKQIVDFEQKINTEPLTKNETKDLFIRSHYEYNFGLKEKIFSLGHSLFGSGTVTFFYAVMFMVSISFSLFFFPNFSTNLAIDFHINIWVLFIIIFVVGYLIARFLGDKIRLKG